MQIRMDEKRRILFMATYVISDIHGEYEAFVHIMNNCSGEIHDKDQE